MFSFSLPQVHLASYAINTSTEIVCWELHWFRVSPVGVKYKCSSAAVVFVCFYAVNMLLNSIKHFNTAVHESDSPLDTLEKLQFLTLLLCVHVSGSKAAA